MRKIYFPFYSVYPDALHGPYSGLHVEFFTECTSFNLLCFVLYSEVLCAESQERAHHWRSVLAVPQSQLPGRDDDLRLLCRSSTLMKVVLTIWMGGMLYLHSNTPSQLPPLPPADIQTESDNNNKSSLYDESLSLWLLLLPIHKNTTAYGNHFFIPSCSPILHGTPSAENLYYSILFVRNGQPFIETFKVYHLNQRLFKDL